MALSQVEILQNPALFRLVKLQSASMLSIREEDPRASANFATQQRWLMSHVGLSLYFRGLSAGHAPTKSESKMLTIQET